MEEELVDYLAASRPRHWPYVGITRAYAIELAMRILDKGGEQPTPAKVQAQLQESVTSNLNGPDTKAYRKVMLSLGYVPTKAGFGNRWAKS